MKIVPQPGGELLSSVYLVDFFPPVPVGMNTK
jgi:hypothetical protein